MRSLIAVALVAFLSAHSVACAEGENNHVTQDCRDGWVVFASNSIVPSDLEVLSGWIRPCLGVEERKREPFTLVITGNGGDVGATAALYDMVATMEGRDVVTVRGLGSLASATIPLFMMGKKREIGPNTQFMFHQVRGYAEGVVTTRDDLERTNFNRAAVDQYVDIVVKNSKLTREQVLKMMDDSVVVYAKQAIEMGLAHSILPEQ